MYVREVSPGGGLLIHVGAMKIVVSVIRAKNGRLRIGCHAPDQLPIVPLDDVSAFLPPKKEKATDRK